MSGETCTVPGCENAHHRNGLCASCYKAMSSLRRLHGEDRARELMLLDPPSDDTEDLSLVDDSAVDDDVVIDLSGDGVVSTASVTRDEAIQSARDAMDRAEAARVSDARNRVAMAFEHKRGTANPEVILWLAQRHAKSPSKETLELLRQAVG